MDSILITGGSGKVGRQFIKHFLENGKEVITTTRNRNNVISALESLEFKSENLRQLHIIEIDLEADQAISELISRLKNRKIKPSVLVHNARSLEYLSIDANNTIPRENFINEFKLDVVIPYELSIAASHTFSSLSDIVFISSIYGVVAPNKQLYEDFDSSSPINYGVCKAAQVQLTKELAVRLATNDINVNCISYGGIDGRVDQKFKQRYSLLTPKGGMLSEEEVIGALEFLTSENSKNITGHNLMVDGGWTIW